MDKCNSDRKGASVRKSVQKFLHRFKPRAARSSTLEERTKLIEKETHEVSKVVSELEKGTSFDNVNEKSHLITK